MSIDSGMDKDVAHIYSGTLLILKKKNVIMLFAAIMDETLEIIILNKVSQRKTYKMIPLICEFLIFNDTN